MVENLLSWRDPVQTGVALGAINIFFMLLIFFDYQLISIVCYMFITVSSVGMILCYIGQEE
jgi:hypothetical protein